MNKSYFFVHVPETAGTSFRRALEEIESVRMLYDYGRKSPEAGAELISARLDGLTPEHAVFHADKFNFICGQVNYRKYAGCGCVHRQKSRGAGRFGVSAPGADDRIFHEFLQILFECSPAGQTVEDARRQTLSGERAVWSCQPLQAFRGGVFEQTRNSGTVAGAQLRTSPGHAGEIQACSARNQGCLREEPERHAFLFRESPRFCRAHAEHRVQNDPPKNAKLRCRIDDEQKLVGGVSCGARECCFIVITADHDRRVVIGLDRCRPDAHEAGLSENPVCGFAYPLSLLGVGAGDELRVGVSGAPRFETIHTVE